MVFSFMEDDSTPARTNHRYRNRYRDRENHSDRTIDSENDVTSAFVESNFLSLASSHHHRPTHNRGRLGPQYMRGQP